MKANISFTDPRIVPGEEMSRHAGFRAEFALSDEVCDIRQVNFWAPADSHVDNRPGKNLEI